MGFVLPKPRIVTRDGEPDEVILSYADWRRIVARFSDDSSVRIPLRRFGRAEAIPVSLSLPCSGSGDVVFSPEPSSPTAHSATVAVSYVGQP